MFLKEAVEVGKHPLGRASEFQVQETSPPGDGPMRGQDGPVERVVLWKTKSPPPLTSCVGL